MFKKSPLCCEGSALAPPEKAKCSLSTRTDPDFTLAGHKSAAWADHFFSSSSTSLTRKLLPMAFQHMQQQGHGKQRSGEHHLVSWWARLISKVLFGPISSTLISAPYPRMQQHGGPETMLVR